MHLVEHLSRWPSGQCFIPKTFVRISKIDAMPFLSEILSRIKHYSIRARLQPVHASKMPVIFETPILSSDRPGSNIVRTFSQCHIKDSFEAPCILCPPPPKKNSSCSCLLHDASPVVVSRCGIVLCSRFPKPNA